MKQLLNKLFFLSILLAVVLLVMVLTGFIFVQDKQIDGVALNAVDGTPIAGAVVRFDDLETTANETGHFVLRTNKYRDLQVQATADGFLPTALSFALPWYGKSGELTVRLQPMALPLLVIAADTGDPLPGVSLTVDGETYITNQAGEMTLPWQVVSPPLNFHFAAPGYLPWQHTLTRMPQDSSELPLVVPLTPHIFQGTVKSAETESPIVQATVIAGEARVHTDDKGQFALSRLSPGTTVIIEPNEHYTPVSFVFNGEDHSVIDIQPKKLSVNVLDSFSGTPLTDAMVQLNALQPATQQQTNALGQAQFSMIPATGELTVARAGYISKTLPYQLDNSLTISLRPNALQGVVRDATSGEPLHQAEMILNGSPYTLGDDGYYSLTNLDSPLEISFKQHGYRTGVIKTQVTNGELTVQTDKIRTQPCRDAAPNPETPLCIDLMVYPFAAKTIYIPFGLLSSPETVYQLFDLVDRTELNAVIIDVKSDTGLLAWDSDVPYADIFQIDGDRDGWMTLRDFIDEAHRRNIYVIGRMVIFKDNQLALGEPALAVAYSDGSVWQDSEGSSWANPFRQEVWAYNTALAQEVAALGVDEVNLDYVRFPSDGNLSSIVYPQENTLETRTTAIRSFVSQMNDALTPYGTALSADVFGLTVWVEPENDMNIGQRVIDIAPYVDYLCPMIYPSTFIAGNLGLDDPSAHPYKVIYDSQTVAQDLVPATTKVRPWLQAYWYDTYEMLQQKQAANDAGSAGWLWWNAGGVYDEAVFDPQ